jgi:hypothetical protein
MRLKIGLPSTLAAAVVLAVLVAACGTADAPAASPDPANQTPTSTPVPPEARQSALEFARAQRLIEDDWEQFHTDFDRWRSGLTSCDRSAAHAALQGFAGDLVDITQKANNLPRSGATRRLADRLIESAEKEEAGLRQLRDRWQPDSTALFEAVDGARSESLASQKAVADDLADLAGSNGLTSLDEARDFSAHFEAVSRDWASVHDSYRSVRDEQDELSAADTSTRLDEVIDELKKVRSAIDDLPTSDSTRSIIADLKEAAAAEEDALTQLKEDFDGQEQPISGQDDSNQVRNLSANTQEEDPTPTIPPTPTPTPAPGEGDQPTPTPAPSEGDQPTPTPEPDETGQPSFTDADAKVSDSDELLKQVEDELQSILNDSSQEPGDLDAFRRQYDLLVRDWDTFHDKYNGWRRNEGGCNRVEVANQLGEFSVRFGNISKRVKDLPQASFLRPMGNSLVDAVQREEEALRILRFTWRPFATDPYRALEQERNNSGQLRRQAGAGVQELMQRFGIAPGEL